MMLKGLISLKEAARRSKIPYTTLKVAAQRYARTRGAAGLEAGKIAGANDWITTQEAVETFLANEYQPNKPKG